jgi:hypothetical protein
MADAEHWLWRLSAAQWLDAARQELAQGRAHAHDRRAALVYARRGAGMALNAVLAALGEEAGEDERPALEARWGRSYVEHLQALAHGDEALRAPLPAEAADAARVVLTTPLRAQVITLGRGPAAEVCSTLDAADRLLAACAAAVPPSLHDG